MHISLGTARLQLKLENLENLLKLGFQFIACLILMRNQYIADFTRVKYIAMIPPAPLIKGDTE